MGAPIALNLIYTATKYITITLILNTVVPYMKKNCKFFSDGTEKILEQRDIPILNMANKCDKAVSSLQSNLQV